MGYAFMLGDCYGCKSVFTFNPHKVPSIVVDGKREPICQSCFDHLNDYRFTLGMTRWPPPAPDAYEAIHESEL